MKKNKEIEERLGCKEDSKVEEKKDNEISIKENRKIVDYIIKTDKELLDRLAREED